MELPERRYSTDILLKSVCHGDTSEGGIILIINSKSKNPLYMQIANQIREQILSGEVKSGNAIKSIRLLAAEKKVSAITIKKSYQILVNEGVLIALKNKGYFVSEFAKEISVEYYLKNIENDFSAVIYSAKSINLGISQIHNLLETCWKDDVCHDDTLRKE